MRERFDGILLTGGRASRLNGEDKPAQPVAGVPLVLRAAAALSEADRLVVVGRNYPGLAASAVLREDPPGSGPASAVATGLRAVTAPIVVLLAADLPFVTVVDVRALVRAAGAARVASLADDGGREQYLCAAWRTSVLRQAVRKAGGRTPSGLSMRAVRVHGGAGTTVPPAPGRPPAWLDCDTADDLACARQWATTVRDGAQR